MTKFVVENLSDSLVKLGIEPWAQLEELPPQKRIEIEYDEPGRLSFSFENNGEATVGVMSSRVTIYGLKETRTFNSGGFF